MSELEIPAAEPAAPPLRVLLVEDDEFDVAVFGRAFHRSGIACEIVRCRRGEEALAGLQDAELELDLLITDHQLPGLSGFDLCLRVLERFQSHPPFALVLLTGVGSEQMAIKALRAGIHDYIVKDSSREYLELLPLVLPKVARRHRRRRSRQLAGRRQGADPKVSRETPLPAAGLGLATCADLIRGRGGRVWVENASREAPALHFSVPLAPGEVAYWTAGREPSGQEAAGGELATGAAIDATATDTAADAGVDSPARPIASSPAVSRHVLVAHPNPVVTFVAQRAAERAGCRCAVVGNGAGVIEALEREPFDLVLMGLELSQLDGLEATRRIRRREAESGGRVTILALGVAADAGERCTEAGMDGVIDSPVSARSVQAAIAELDQLAG